MRSAWLGVLLMMTGLLAVVDARPPGDKASHRIVEGSVVARVNGSGAHPISKVRVRCLDSNGKTGDQSQFADTDLSGNFSIEIPENLAQFKLSFIHLANAYWPREMDFSPKKNPYDVGVISLRPQSEVPPDSERAEIRQTILDLQGQDSFLAALISTHLPDNQTPVAGKLAGSGSTSTLYASWTEQYNRIHPDTKVSYQSVASGGGIRQLEGGTVDFGSSEVPLTDEQLNSMRGRIVHLPTAVISIVPIYNLPSMQGDIRFTQQALAGIFLGKITRWNDPALRESNPKLALPDMQIAPVHRSDGNGVTYIFSDFLSKVSLDWLAAVGKGSSIKWPVGSGAKGDEGMAGLVKERDGAIGYVDLPFALENHLSFGAVQNAAGNFVKADAKSTTAAAASVPIPPDFRVSLTNAPGPNAYPIAAFTYVLVPAEGSNANGKILLDFLNWSAVEGQESSSRLDYAPLPPSVTKQVHDKIRTLH